MSKWDNTLWMARKWGKYPNAYIRYIKQERLVNVKVFPGKIGDGYYFEMDRRLARLVAKRLLQCLKETK